VGQAAASARLMLALVVMLFGTACGSATAIGVWQGTYFCQQGETGLRLEISAGAEDTLNAKFSFYAIPSNPEVPSGSFAMVGKYSESGIVLRQDHWIEQPPEWRMVDLRGTLADRGTMFRGTVETVDCTSFSLRRV
jgi:hypothetical protein